MAHILPRLEWNFIEVTGTITEGSNIITDMSSVVGLLPGMYVEMDGFTSGATIGMTDAFYSTISLSIPSDAEGVFTRTFSARFRLDFPYPSVKQVAPEYIATEKISESVGGVRQVQLNNIIKKVSMEFKFLPQALIYELENNFYLSWAVYGKKFRYIEVTDEEYELDSFDFRPVREIPKDGDYLYRLPLKFRRVYL